MVSNHAELGTERIRTLMLRYALPAIMAMTASSLYNIVDSIFIGHGVGALALSGLTIAKPFMDISTAFGTLVGVGAGALMAIKLGEKDIESASKVLGNVVVLNIILSLAFMIVSLIFLDPILMAFGASEDTIEYARDYMFIILLGNITTHIYFGLNNLLRSSGHPYTAMYATILAVTLNIALDPVFIFVLDMGVRGAALATIISQCVGLTWEIIIFCNKKEPIHFHSGIWRLDKQITLDSLSIGLSPFLMNLASCLVVVILNNQLKRFGGDMAIGAYGVINRFTFVFCMIVMGLNQGMQPIAGYNYGARQYDRVLRVFNLTACAATVITSIVCLLGLICPQYMVRIFTHDAELIAVSSHAMRIVNCAFFLVGFQMVTGNFFTSIGKAKKAIFMSLSRQVLILVPLLLLLPALTQSINGVWWSIALSDALSACIAYILLTRQIRFFRNISEPDLIED